MKGTGMVGLAAWLVALGLMTGMIVEAAAAAPAPAPRVVAPAFACPPRKATEAEKAKIAKLIEAMGDEVFDTREAASRAVLDHGEAALPQLTAAYKDSKNLEVRRRCERAVDKIRYKAVDDADLPSIFVLPEHLREAVYMYYREAAGDETYYPIEAKLGRLGHWLRTQCDVSAGTRVRARNRGEAVEKEAMRKLVDEMRTRAGSERTLEFIRRLKNKKAHTYDEKYFGEYRWKGGNTLDPLDRFAKGIPETPVAPAGGK